MAITTEKVTVTIPIDLAKQVRAVAARNGQNMSAFYVDALRKQVSRRLAAEHSAALAHRTDEEIAEDRALMEYSNAITFAELDAEDAKSGPTERAA